MSSQLNTLSALPFSQPGVNTHEKFRPVCHNRCSRRLRIGFCLDGPVFAAMIVREPLPGETAGSDQAIHNEP